MRWKETFSFLLVILLIGFVNASFDLGNPEYSIQNSYELGDRIVGWINISFTDEPYDSLFMDSFGNNVSVQTLLDNNPSYVYNDTLPTLTADMQIMSLEDAFMIPSIVGNLHYELNLTGIELFSEEITVNSSQNLTLKVETAQAINQKKQEIQDFLAERETYSDFIKSKLNIYFNIFYLEELILDLESNYTDADSDEDYQEIRDEIESIKIPKSVFESNSINNLNFYSKSEHLDFGVLADITKEDYSELNSANYETSLFIWTQDSIDVRISYKEISASYGTSDEVLFNYFEIDFIQTPLNQDVYLIIQDLPGLEFDGYYGQQELEYYQYINLKNINYEKVSFATTANVDFTTVPMFISPALANLPDTGPVIIDGKREMKISKWFFFGLIILFVLVVGLVIYSFVSTWYDRKYEKHLFPNRNNLYNLIIFINNSKRKGISDEEIAKSLRKSKWSREQIAYVMKKYAGKRTGMAKLPFGVVQKKPKKPDKSVKPSMMRGPTGRAPTTRKPPRYGTK